MVIWKTVPVVINRKMTHVRKVGGKRYTAFILDYGDVPCWRFNEVTGKREPVVNARGNAYGARNRLQHHKRKQDARHPGW